MQISLLTVILIALASCHSPMNRRVQLEKTQTSSQEVCFDTLDMCAEAQWLMGPQGSMAASNHLLLIVRDSKGLPTDLPKGLTLEFYSEMPSMGHGPEEPGFFKSLGDGLYLNQSIQFGMGGDWLHTLILQRDGQIQEKVQWEEFFLD